MKKKFLDCDIHDFTLFRCKRRCWKGAPGRSYASKFEEKCFKCISEDRNEKVEITEEKKRHFRI